MSISDKIKKKMGLSPAQVEKLPPKPTLKSRLPKTSRFEASWDGEVWSGTLAFPIGETNDCYIVSARHTSLTKLCYKLDDLYREWKAKQQPAGDANELLAPPSAGD